MQSRSDGLEGQQKRQRCIVRPDRPKALVSFSRPVGFGVNQHRDAADLRGDGDTSIAGGKRKPTGRIDIALIHSLVRNAEVSDLVADYGHLIIDECHHLSAVSFELVARRTKARF
ncbi:MAG: hypothetical protein ACKVP7_10675, partial [Hyphomicrobiaceae bacterium]